MTASLDILAEFVHRTQYADLPDEVIRHAKLHMLDFLAVAFWGFKRGLHRPFLKLGQKSSSSGAATVIGEGITVPWPQAALINSSMCPADMTDGSRFAGLHPSSMVFPSALSAFEAHSFNSKMDGRSLLLAVVVGYEVMIRIGRVMNPSAVKRGFHLTPVVGPLASAAAAGKIMGLHPEEMANAFCISATLGSGFLHSFQAPQPFVQTQIARACEAGSLAAILSREGIQGNRRILEEAFIPAHADRFDPPIISQRLGEEFMIPQTYMKIHAGCRHIHAPIDATLFIMNQNRLSWNEVRQIKVKTYSVARELEVENPQTGDEAKFSMPFGIAVALIRGDASHEQFNDLNLKDPQIQALMKRVVVETSPELDQDYPEKRGTVIELTLYNGKTFTHALDVARGEPEFPLRVEEVEAKFMKSAFGLIELEAMRRVIGLVHSLEDETEPSKLLGDLQVKK